MEEQSFDPRRVIEMFQRRGALMMKVALALIAVACVVAYVWPPTYRSTATILIEEQEIPQDFVRSTITSFADQRIQVINQTALTRNNLLQLVNKYSLYPKRTRFITNDEIADLMRKSISVVPVTANVSGRGGGQTVTIAFRVSFEYPEAIAAQSVANDLTTLYLNENVKQRQQRTAETSTFVVEEARRLLAQISQTEMQIESFKVRNAGKLPEQSQVNAQLIERSRMDVERLSRELSGLEDRRAFYEAQLSVAPRTASTAAGVDAERPSDPVERLRALRTQLASISGVYSEVHPDVVRLKREIAGLERVTGAVDDSAELNRQLSDARDRLNAATDRYAPDHPENVQLRRRVAGLEKALAELKSGKAPDAPGSSARRDTSDNPMVANLQAQLQSVRTQINMIQSERDDLRKRVLDYEARLGQSPLVEREYGALTRDLANATARYQQIRGKVMEAEVAQQLEKDRKAERFSLVEPALLPDAPYKPNRTLILLIGVVLAVGAGIAIGLLRDLLDPTIKSALELETISSLPVLAAIPLKRSRQVIEVRRTRTRLVLVGGATCALSAMVFIHLEVMPLNIFWLITMRRLGTLHTMLL